MKRPVPSVLAISDGEARSAPADGSIERWIAAVEKAGVDGIQLREKRLDDRDLFDLAERAMARLGSARRAALLINGRADIACAVGADGTHLPADGLAIDRVRQRFGAEMLIGRSTHHPDEVAAARADGADYVTFGPIFDTPSKARYGSPLGLEGLAAAAAHGLPVIALGGINATRVAAVAAAGAAGIAGIRAAHDPVELARWVQAARASWPRRERQRGETR